MPGANFRAASGPQGTRQEPCVIQCLLPPLVIPAQAGIQFLLLIFFRARAFARPSGARVTFLARARKVTQEHAPAHVALRASCAAGPRPLPVFRGLHIPVQAAESARSIAPPLRASRPRPPPCDGAQEQRASCAQKREQKQRRKAEAKSRGEKQRRKAEAKSRSEKQKRKAEAKSRGRKQRQKAEAESRGKGRLRS